MNTAITLTNYLTKLHNTCKSCGHMDECDCCLLHKSIKFLSSPTLFQDHSRIFIHDNMPYPIKDLEKDYIDYARECYLLGEEPQIELDEFIDTFTEIIPD